MVKNQELIIEIRTVTVLEVTSPPRPRAIPPQLL